ncbi:MAG: hypothetical protein AN484_25070 [Aphanizomenon flos-aquae WA102]|jgi:hypothetical protein|uniref:Uncharacterized protein n=1 Tax=Aphanizomenon flos-aquae WA102 TaxID=1710896 RepID=A0A1B7WJK9_APHFL|nr:MAG: hypothetical protein AN484_25070 [Aphanizomenon flos-aquae WA102]
MNNETFLIKNVALSGTVSFLPNPVIAKVPNKTVEAVSESRLKEIFKMMFEQAKKEFNGFPIETLTMTFEYTRSGSPDKLYILDYYGEDEQGKMNYDLFRTSLC